MMSDWSKLSGSVFFRVSNALTDGTQQPNKGVSQQDIDLNNIDFSKIWAKILSALGQAGRLLVKWWGIIWSSVLVALIAVNGWSIAHPYAAAGALMLISAFTNTGAFLTLLQLTGAIAVFLCFLPVQLIIWCVGFRSQGVAHGSFASQYQSSRYGSTVPRGSGFAHLQSFGATTWPVSLTLVSLLSYAGVVIVLGREWGLWL